MGECSKGHLNTNLHMTMKKNEPVPGPTLGKGKRAVRAKSLNSPYRQHVLQRRGAAGAEQPGGEKLRTAEDPKDTRATNRAAWHRPNVKQWQSLNTTLTTTTYFGRGNNCIARYEHMKTPPSGG